MKTLILFLLLNIQNSYASGKHDHEKTKSSKATDQFHKESHEEDHKEGHEEGHEEQNELPAGVTFFKDETGEFSLKKNVIQNFGIVHKPALKEGSLYKAPSDTIVRSLMDTNVFVLNDNTFRSIKVNVVRTDRGSTYFSSSEDLSKSSLVIKGANFLKTILLSLEEGPSEGHGH